MNNRFIDTLKWGARVGQIAVYLGFMAVIISISLIFTNNTDTIWFKFVNGYMMGVTLAFITYYNFVIRKDIEKQIDAEFAKDVLGEIDGRILH